MIFKKYNDFRQGTHINETIQVAKAFLKKRALAKKREDENNPEAILTPDEEKAAENDKDFLEIRKFLGNDLGYAGLFTRFHYEFGVPIDELKKMYQKLMANKQFFSLLSMTLDKYPNIKGNKESSDPEEQKNGYELLEDDLDKIREERIATKWINQMYANIKQEYRNAAPLTRAKVRNIAVAFEELGKDENGVVDPKKNAELQMLFFKKAKKYTTLKDTMDIAEDFIKATNNDGLMKMVKAIDKVNLDFGEINGADIIYDKDDILIVDIKSYQAANALCSHTSWCFRNSIHHWNNYVGGDDKFTKQYAIYNYNLPPSDDKSAIGLTVDINNKITHCHTKGDMGYTDGIQGYLKKWNIPPKLLVGMTKEEAEKKRKRIAANKEIVEPNLSIDQLRKCIEDGADPNASEGIVLTNAVESQDMAKVQFLLDQGASPVVAKTAIKKAKSLPLIKLLIKYRSAVPNEVINEYIMKDYDSVVYILENGISPNVANGLPLRQAVKEDNVKIIDLLMKNGADLTIRRFIAIKWAIENDNLKVADYLFNIAIKQMKEGKYDKVIDDKTDESSTEILFNKERNGFNEEWLDDTLDWTGSSGKDGDKARAEKFINDKRKERF